MRQGQKPVKLGDFVATQPLITPRSEGIIVGRNENVSYHKGEWICLMRRKGGELGFSFWHGYDLWLLIPCS